MNMSKMINEPSAPLGDVSMDELRAVSGGLGDCPVLGGISPAVFSRAAEWKFKLKDLKFRLPDFPPVQLRIR